MTHGHNIFLIQAQCSKFDVHQYDKISTQYILVMVWNPVYIFTITAVSMHTIELSYPYSNAMVSTYTV